MGRSGGETFAKRQKEIARQERAKEKARKRDERSKAAKNQPKPDGDPDIDWIVPGPQPLPDQSDE